MTKSLRNLLHRTVRTSDSLQSPSSPSPLLLSNSSLSLGPLASTLNPSNAELDTESCALLGPFAIVIQTLMAIIVLGSLLFRRHREKPKRKFRIWTADVSKQVIGQAFVHILNIFISDSLASLPSQGNPCALYFMNILVDTTIGVFILYLALNSITVLLCRIFKSSPASLGVLCGTYPSPFLVSWSKQLGVYLAALVVLKVVVIWMFWLGGDGLVRFGNRIMDSVSSDGRVQILVVVMIGPTCLNVMQFLLVDSFLKHRPNLNRAPPLPLEPELRMRMLDMNTSGSSTQAIKILTTKTGPSHTSPSYFSTPSFGDDSLLEGTPTLVAQELDLDELDERAHLDPTATQS